MKIIIAGDIHGSAYWCKRLTDYFKKSGASLLLLTGDILYHGPRNDLPRDYAPKTVANLLNEVSDKIMCVRGNCEAEVDSLLLDFAIAENAYLLYGDKKLFVCHGHKNPDKLSGCDTLINGHTHVPAFKGNSCTTINPGSVSIPKEDSPHSLILLDGDSVNYIDLETESIYKSEKM